MEIDPDDPLGMMRKVVAETTELRAKLFDRDATIAKREGHKCRRKARMTLKERWAAAEAARTEGSSARGQTGDA